MLDPVIFLEYPSYEYDVKGIRHKDNGYRDNKVVKNIEEDGDEDSDNKNDDFVKEEGAEDMQYDDALFKENVADDDDDNDGIQRSKDAVREERVRNNNVRTESGRDDRVRKVTMEDLKNAMADSDNNLNMPHKFDDDVNLGCHYRFVT